MISSVQYQNKPCIPKSHKWFIHRNALPDEFFPFFIFHPFPTLTPPRNCFFPSFSFSLPIVRRRLTLRTHNNVSMITTWWPVGSHILRWRLLLWLLVQLIINMCSRTPARGLEWWGLFSLFIFTISNVGQYEPTSSRRRSCYRQNVICQHFFRKTCRICETQTRGM